MSSSSIPAVAGAVVKRKRGRPRKNKEGSMEVGGRRTGSELGGRRVFLRSEDPGTDGKVVSSCFADGKEDGRMRMQGESGPAELFRTDYITAMKLHETEVVDMTQVMKIVEPWRHEWNRGVQIPVHPEDAPPAVFKRIPAPSDKKELFRRPKKRIFVRKTDSESFDGELHVISQAAKKAGKVCRYDLDDLDVRWLRLLNEKRLAAGLSVVSEDDMERLVEALETVCHEQIQDALMTGNVEPLGREYDEDAVCDVCFRPEVYLDDEIVFCDRCDLAVHQTCYGVGTIPSGTWLCRACTLSATRPPQCILCPNRNGALKCTGSGERWAHVSCVWWIPEVKFEDPDKMEPIINVNKIPAERWNLRCHLCHRKEGACIQCSVNKCPVAYHVTCAQRNQLYMNIKPGNRNEGEELKLVSFCPKHTGEQGEGESGERSVSPPPSRARPVPESPQKRKQKRQTVLENRFFVYASPDAISHFPADVVQGVFEFWKLKRRITGNGSLLTPKDEEEDILEKHEREVLSRKVKVLLALRQNLEKARNLCYMVHRRERMRMQYVKTREEQFRILHRFFSNESLNLSKREMEGLGKYLQCTSSYERESYGYEDGGAEECDQKRNTDKPRPVNGIRKAGWNGSVRLRRDLPLAQLHSAAPKLLPVPSVKALKRCAHDESLNRIPLRKRKTRT